MVVIRSRTGCLTCRSRKLKCDEVKPICGQCAKANRECRPADGLAFRHQQNASMNDEANDGGGGNLKSFYGYKNTFSKTQPWVQIPGKLTFIHITDPYADDHVQPLLSTPPIALGSPTSGTYQNIASHSLEALSTAATAGSQHAQNQPSYIPQSQNPFNDIYSVTYGNSPPPMTRALRKRNVGAGAGVGQNSSSPAAGGQNNTNLSFLLNPSAAALNSVIDPNLENSTAEEREFADEVDVPEEKVTVDRGVGNVGNDQSVAELLRGFQPEG